MLGRFSIENLENDHDVHEIYEVGVKLVCLATLSPISLLPVLALRLFHGTIPQLPSRILRGTRNPGLIRTNSNRQLEAYIQDEPRSLR